jgi:acetylornithine deacetylase
VNLLVWYIKLKEPAFYKMNTDLLYSKAVQLLKQLIAIPSFSKEEHGTAQLLQHWLMREGIAVQRKGNNIYAVAGRTKKPVCSLLLNSHHDTVRPAGGYTRDPFLAFEQEGRLYGLGSNDAGASLVALAVTFLHFAQQDIPFKLILAATAEEEISGKGGIEFILPDLGNIDCAIVGEPTGMKMAVAERGLMVLDAVARGVSGHAARKEGENAIYKTMQDIAWFAAYTFDHNSELLGPVSMQVTVIDTENKAHNVVPDQCRFTVDVRMNEHYTHQELLDTIRANVHSDVQPRSTRLRSTLIASGHPLVQAGKALGFDAYGSPTISDKALMPFPALKIGPGASERSHTADEFIILEEIRQGIEGYIALINQFSQQINNDKHEAMAEASHIR